MKSATSPGSNRTGIATSPALAAELVEATRETRPSTRGDARALATVRIDYALSAEPAGTMPAPATLKEAARSMMKAVKGQKATVFLDKLGERLAFERSGVRLYEAVISKLEAFGSWPGGPSLEDLTEIRNEEREHFLLIKRAMESLGADPTAVTPSANAHGVLTRGLPALLGDPRTNLQQGLEAILVAELIDNDCWENLIDLARSLDQEDLASQMDGALLEEKDHLQRVRGWITAALSSDAGGDAARFRRERGAPRPTPARPPRATSGGRRRAKNGTGRSRSPKRRSSR